MITASELRGKKPEELKQLLQDLLKEQFNLRMQKGSGQLSKSSRMRGVRRDIARIKMVMNESASGGGR